MQRDSDMVHTDGVTDLVKGVMSVSEHRKFKIRVYNAIVDVENKLELSDPGEKKDISGDKDLSADSVLDLITALKTKVDDYLSTQRYAMHAEMNKRSLAFADATVKLHDQWETSKTSINPGPRGEYNPYLIGSTPTGLTPNRTGITPKTPKPPKPRELEGHKTRIADHKEFVDPKTIKAKNKKEMLERWEAMKKELEAEGYTNIHSQFH